MKIRILPAPIHGFKHIPFALAYWKNNSKRVFNLRIYALALTVVI